MNKYRAHKTVIDGIEFDSRKEANRYSELKLLERAKEISSLEMQKRYELIPSQYDGKKCLERSVNYIADFVYDDHGKTIVEDTKGVKTKDYIIKRKLMLQVHGIRIKEI